MVIKSVNLETVCGITSTLPENSLPEIAFAGKSNVGKSSLINGLMNRKNYARTSAQPGKTQTINFYNINNELYFVDLPGYGYANASVKVKAKWGKMIERYLHTSKQLKAVFLLIDEQMYSPPFAADCAKEPRQQALADSRTNSQVEEKSAAKNGHYIPLHKLPVH